MDIRQLRTELIRPVLEKIGMWSRSAEDLLVGTACQESACGNYIRQLNCRGTTGAFGIFQMELNTHNDIWNNFLKYKPVIAEKIKALRVPSMSDAENLEYNLAYAVAMCRAHYYRIPVAIPDGVHAQAQYWKDHYNTKLGKGSVEEYISNWCRFNG